MTNHRRVLLLPALVSATLLGLVATRGGIGAAAAQSAPGRVDLAGTVTLEGSGPGDFPVHIPQPATITLAPRAGQPNDATVQGRGRVVGFLLHQDGGWNTIIASDVRYGFCTTPGCSPNPPTDGNVGFYDPTKGVAEGGTLPPGDYHLYFIADAAPAVVTLHLHGLTGSLVLHPREPAPVEVLTAPTTVALPPLAATGPMDYAAGVLREVPSGAATSILMWSDSPLPDAASSTGTCAYQGSPPPDFPAYSYPCHGAVCCMGAIGGSFQVSPHGGVLGLTGEYRAFEEDGVLEAPGVWGVGGYVQSADLVTDAHVVEAWVKFDDSATSSGTPSPPTASHGPLMPTTSARAARDTLSLPLTAPADSHDAGAALAAILVFTVVRRRKQ